MKHKKILLTGGSGKLGQAIINSGLFPKLLNPYKNIFDITRPETMGKFFADNDIDTIIHCAALARMKECEEDPVKAIKTNIMGTSNLVAETMRKEKERKEKIRFVHISTDGVYAGIKGNYSENEETIPYNTYGWTKLGAECAVNTLSDFCIIRTNFFDPKNISFDKSATDAYSSKIPIAYLVKAISIMLNNAFIGTINIGDERKSDYERYREHKPLSKPCKFEDILKEAGFPMAKDASMDCTMWKKIIEKNNR